MTTEAVDGNKALVKEDVVVNGPDGQPIPGLAATYWYAIDRKTTEEIPNFTDNSGVDDNRQGLVIGFPIGTEQRTYDGLERRPPGAGAGGVRGGRRPRGDQPPTTSTRRPTRRPLKDPAVLAMFPASHAQGGAGGPGPAARPAAGDAPGPGGAAAPAARPGAR